jgi:hypothetical protein
MDHLTPNPAAPGTQTGSKIRLPLVTERSLQETCDSCSSLSVDLKEAVKLQSQYVIPQNINPYNFDENGNFIGWCDYYSGRLLPKVVPQRATLLPIPKRFRFRNK